MREKERQKKEEGTRIFKKQKPQGKGRKKTDFTNNPIKKKRKH